MVSSHKKNKQTNRTKKKKLKRKYEKGIKSEEKSIFLIIDLSDKMIKQLESHFKINGIGDIELSKLKIQTLLIRDTAIKASLDLKRSKRQL